MYAYHTLYSLTGTWDDSLCTFVLIILDIIHSAHIEMKKT